MKHELPPLPYDLNALEPILTKEIIDIHYNKHHKGYVDKLNALLPNSGFEFASLEEIIRKAPVGSPLFNNAGQSWNHSFYWNSLIPPLKQTSLIEYKDLHKALIENFGTIESFMTQFEEIGMSQFGSGWVWLVQKGQQLAIEKTSNAQTPLQDSNLNILLTCDVWEHAYYLKYRNERNHYLKNFWKIVNWTFAAQNYVNTD